MKSVRQSSRSFESPNEERRPYESRPLILGIGGTLRPSSRTEFALKVSLAAAERAGARTILFGSKDLMLPLYNPTDAALTATAQRFVSLVRDCDGLIIASPAYHGVLSGVVKNALDYIEELRSNDRPYLHGRAVGCISCADGWQAVGSALVSLRSVVHALRGWPTPLGVGVNSACNVFDAEGKCLDKSIQLQLETVGTQVVEFARLKNNARNADREAPARASAAIVNARMT